MKIIDELTLYNGEDMEKLGFTKHEHPVLWEKSKLGGREFFIKCNGCGRFFKTGTKGNDVYWIDGEQCIFCNTKYKIQIRTK